MLLFLNALFLSYEDFAIFIILTYRLTLVEEWKIGLVSFPIFPTFPPIAYEENKSMLLGNSIPCDWKQIKTYGYLKCALLRKISCSLTVVQPETFSGYWLWRLNCAMLCAYLSVLIALVAIYIYIFVDQPWVMAMYRDIECLGFFLFVIKLLRWLHSFMDDVEYTCLIPSCVMALVRFSSSRMLSFITIEVL